MSDEWGFELIETNGARGVSPHVVFQAGRTHPGKALLAVSA